jgi:SAM-dependent methyltransferase
MTMPGEASGQQSPALLEKYERYYLAPDHRWREIGAVDKARNIADLCRSVPHRTILDVGAGDGAVINQLSAQNFSGNFYALDIAAPAVEFIKARGLPCVIESRTFNGYNLPYESDQFDLAICTHVLEHVEHPRRLLYELQRVARYLFVEVPLELNWRMPQDYQASDVGHINFFSPKTIRQLLQSSGYEVVAMEVTQPALAAYRYAGGLPGILRYCAKRLLLKLSPALATSAFTYHAALLCRQAPSVGLEVRRAE